MRSNARLGQTIRSMPHMMPCEACSVLIRKAAQAENLERLRARGSIVRNLRHHVRGPAVVVIDTVAAAAIPVDGGGAVGRKKILVCVVVPDFGNNNRAKD